MYDEVGMIQDAFTFRLINNSVNSVNYELYLNKISTSRAAVLRDLSMADVRYYLKKDDEIKGPNYLGSLFGGAAGQVIKDQVIKYCKYNWPFFDSDKEITSINECVESFREYNPNINMTADELIPSLVMIDIMPSALDLGWAICNDEGFYNEAECAGFLSSDAGTTLSSYEDIGNFLVEMYMGEKIDLSIVENKRNVACAIKFDAETDEECVDAFNYEFRKNFTTIDEVTDYMLEIGMISDKTFEVSDGMIDSGIIAGGDTIEYSFGMWIDANVVSNEAISGKSLSYKFDLKVNQIIEPGPTDQSCFEYRVSDYVVQDYKACADYLLEKGISSDINLAMHDCGDITEGISYISEDYPFEFQEMIANGVIKETRGVTITDYTCSSDTVIIPSSFSVSQEGVNPTADAEADTKLLTPVVAIGHSAFRKIQHENSIYNDNYSMQFMSLTQLTSLRKVVMPDTVLHVNERAFSNINLQEVTLSNKLQAIIGYGAFEYNQLKNVDLPDSLIFIGIQAFMGNNLTEITLPDNYTYIDWEVFAENDLRTVNIFGDIGEIIGYAFFDNPNLTSIYNYTNKSFDWYYICFGIEGQDPFDVGTLTDNGQTITVYGEK